MKTDTEAPGSELGSDRPIESKNQDRLGRTQFSQQLARAIKGWDGAESLVIAICGPWGIGKSSLKNLVLEELRNADDRTPEIIQFNPWQWTGHESLTGAFFREVLSGLAGKRDKNAKEVARTLRRYAAYLGAIGAILRGPRGLLSFGLVVFGLLAIVPPLFISGENTHILVTILGAAALGLAAVLTWSEDVLNRIAKWTDFTDANLRSLEERKQDVVSALRRYEKTLLVVVDDIDRLTAAEIQAVFQLIKANADFPRFVYLIMFQRQTVESALAQVTNEGGRRFLEKIVQVSFDVPRARQDEVDKVLSEGLERVLGASATSAVNSLYWGNIYFGSLRGYFRDLRDVKRFLASFEFHANLLRTGQTLDVNAVDLIAVESLRLFEPELYGSIRDGKGILTGSHTSSDKARITEEIKAVVAKASPDKAKAATELVRSLFPTAAFALGGPTYSSDHHSEWSRDLRICDPEFFDRYFQLELSKGDVSQLQVEQLLSQSSNYNAFTEALEALNASGQLAASLDRLEANRTNITSDNAVPALTALFDIGERLPEPDPANIFGGPDWTINRIAYAVLKEEPEAERILKIEAILNATVGLRIPVMFVSINTNTKDLNSSGAKVIIPEDAAGRLREICVVKIRKAALEGVLLGRYDLLYLLYRWRDWGYAAEAREWAEDITKASPESALAFLRAFLHRGTTHTAGDHVAQIRYFMKYSEVEQFADMEVLAKQIEQLVEPKLSENDRRVVQEFRKALARKRSGKQEGDFGWEDDR